MDHRTDPALDRSQRLAAATRLLATLRAGRARVERLAEQHLRFEQLVELYGMGLADDPVDDLRHTQELISWQVQAWRQVRGAAVAASVADVSARSRIAPPPPPADPPALLATLVPEEPEELAPAPPAAPEPAPPEELAPAAPEPELLPGLGPPRSVGVAAVVGGTPMLASSSEPDEDDPSADDEPQETLDDGPAFPSARTYDFALEEPLPDEPEQIEIGLRPEELAGGTPEPPPAWTSPAPAEALDAAGGEDRWVAFGEEDVSEDEAQALDEEEEYDPWAARRAALEQEPLSEAPDAPPEPAAEQPAAEQPAAEQPVSDPTATDGPDAEQPFSPALDDKPAVDDELDTLNDFTTTAGDLVDEEEDASDQGTGGGLGAPRTVGPRAVGPRIETDDDEPGSLLGPSSDIGTRVVLAPEPETGSVRPIHPGMVESLTNELDAAPAGDDFLLEDEGGHQGFSVSFEQARRPGPAPREEESEELTRAPRLTDDEPVAGVDSSLELTPLAEVDQGRLTEFVRAAHDAEVRGDLHDAITRYGDAIDLAPEKLDAYLGRGRAHMELGDYAAAMSDFQRAEDLAPGAPAPLAEMGNLYFARKEYRRAIEFYDQALEIDASLAMARCRRGICHHYRRNHKQAFQDLQKAYSLDPDIPNIRKYVQMAVKAMERDRPGRR